MTLHHITLNTGHVALTERADVADDVIAALRPLVLAADAKLPAPVPLWLEMERFDGWAEYLINSGPAMRSRTINYVGCVCCWSEAGQDAAEQALLRYAAFTGWPEGTDPKPETERHHLPLPWLAVSLTFDIARLPAGVVSMLGDVERCIFWTLQELDAC